MRGRSAGRARRPSRHRRSPSPQATDHCHRDPVPPRRARRRLCQSPARRATAAQDRLRAPSAPPKRRIGTPAFRWRPHMHRRTNLKVPPCDGAARLERFCTSGSSGLAPGRPGGGYQPRPKSGRSAGRAWHIALDLPGSDNVAVRRIRAAWAVRPGSFTRDHLLDPGRGPLRPCRRPSVRGSC